VKQVDTSARHRTRRNAKISGLFIAALLAGLLGLAVASQIENSQQAGILSLNDYRSEFSISDQSIDPLGICAALPGFELYAVSSDGMRLGYTSSQANGPSSRLLVDHLTAQGWHQQESELTASSQAMLIFEYHNTSDETIRLMLVQLFPLSSGCSIVIEFY